MPTVAFVYPISPGKLQTWHAMYEAWEGDRRSEYLESRSRAGITRVKKHRR